MSDSLDFDDLDEGGEGFGGNEDIFGISDQIVITASNISTDFTFADKFNFKPLSSDDVHFRLNGLWQREGASRDYSVNIASKEIQWLAGSGTGVDIAVGDEIIVYYRHANVA